MKDLFLRIKDLNKIYYKKKTPLKKALQNASFDLYKGEVMTLLGVNGAGKTTLSTLLASLHPPTSGDIEYKGKSIYKQILPYRKIIGFCPQNPNLDKNLTLEENLIFSGKCYGLTFKQVQKKMDELIERFDLKDYKKARSEILSGGLRQRFLLARSLMHSPEFILLDEPTVGLDPHIRRSLWEIIKDLKQSNLTILLTTHYLDEAEYLSDRVAFIHKGTIRTIDTPQNLQKHHQKNNLEEVFLKFVDDPEASLFNSTTTEV